MFASIFTALAVGINALSTAGYATFGTIVASATFIAGSFITTGHQFILPDANTTTTPSIYYEGVTNKILAYTQTGTVQYVGSLARAKETYTTCTSTGGLTNYSTCWLPSPLSTTGSLLEASLECGNVPQSLAGDVSFKINRLSASGTALTNLNNITAGSGALEVSDFATEVAWNPAEGLSFSTLTDPLGASVDCRLWAVYSDKYGS